MESGEELSPLEKQMMGIMDKQALHDWVDSLPEEAAGIVLVSYDEVDRMRVRYREIGNPTIAQLLYLLETYKYRLINEATGA